MFDDITDQRATKELEPTDSIFPKAPTSPSKQVEDIFSDVDSSTGLHGVRPDAFQSKASISPGDIARVNSASRGGAVFMDNLKRLALLGIMIIVVGGILWVGWYGFNKIFRSNGGPTVTPTTDLNPEDTNIIENVVEEVVEEPVAEKVIEEPVADITDTDQDGLTDAEETRLGMNINSVDTDDDGLFDRQEVETYKTDPLNADTDGDGYSDGEEVKNNYNPNGPGKLYEIQ